MALFGLANVKAAIDKSVDNVNNGLRAAYLDGLGRVIQETSTGLTQGELPNGVKSTSGQTRNNWFLSVGFPSSSTTTSKSTGLSSVRQLSSMPKNVLGKKIYLTNNSDHINMIEYGGYPKQVGQGTRLSSGKYIKLSSGGFSIQAPKGMARTNLLKIAKKVRTI